MSYPTTVEEYYQRIKTLLNENGYTTNPFRPVQHGIQFIIFRGSESGIIRIFNSKKGLTLDLSQIKDENMKSHTHNLLAPIELERGKRLKFTSSIVKEKNGPAQFEGTPKKDPDELIGIDESGKGDYFGPLVVAAVYINPTIAEELKKRGVQDSKKLNDTKIAELAKYIEENCPHSMVILANKSYNEIYEKIPNLNNILAWGHARVLENVLTQVDCPYALSDQFGDPNLIRAKLYAKGLQVILFSRPRAEENIAVAAASILARNKFVTYIQEISDKFKTHIPKGSGDIVMAAAKRFVKEHGIATLPYVVKLHFKLTKQLQEKPTDAPTTHS